MNSATFRGDADSSIVEKFLGHWHVTADIRNEGSCPVVRECVLCDFTICHGDNLDRSLDEINADIDWSAAEVERHDRDCHPGDELWAQKRCDFRGDLQAAMQTALESKAALYYGLELLEWPDTFEGWKR